MEPSEAPAACLGHGSAGIAAPCPLIMTSGSDACFIYTLTCLGVQFAQDFVDRTYTSASAPAHSTTNICVNGLVSLSASIHISLPSLSAGLNWDTQSSLVCPHSCCRRLLHSSPAAYVNLSLLFLSGAYLYQGLRSFL